MRPMLLAVSAALSVATVACTAAGPPGLSRERVLAEAVSSYNDTGAVFLVQDTMRPFPVRGYYPTLAAADSAARVGATYRAYGPYSGLTTRDPWEVLSITVRVRTTAGERDFHYDPRTVDALFLSMSAVRKFLLPYYRDLYGPEFADAVAAGVVVPLPPGPVCHRMSFPCIVDSLIIPDVR
jgi:hypothetical protein